MKSYLKNAVWQKSSHTSGTIGRIRLDNGYTVQTEYDVTQLDDKRYSLTLMATNYDVAYYERYSGVSYQRLSPDRFEKACEAISHIGEYLRLGSVVRMNNKESVQHGKTGIISDIKPLTLRLGNLHPLDAAIATRIQNEFELDTTPVSPSASCRVDFNDGTSCYFQSKYMEFVLIGEQKRQKSEQEILAHNLEFAISNPWHNMPTFMNFPDDP